jgi:hypothetical protein
MPLPVRTALADIEAICGYFFTKPAGVTAAEVMNEKALDQRKLSALKFWGLIEDAGSKLRLSERGLLVARDKGAHRASALREVVASIPPYGSVVARAVHRNEMVVLSTVVAAYWHQHFRAFEDLRVLNWQTVCFFRVAEGADLGRLVVGRKGLQTRFELSEDSARAFVDDPHFAISQAETEPDSGSSGEAPRTRDRGGFKTLRRWGNRVFITQRKNKKILEQVKELVAFGKFEPVLGRETCAKPFPQDLMDEMRGCDTAVIHVGADGLRFEADRNQEPRIDGDVLIEIGAAMALYGHNFILLVEEGVKLPSNLQGLCECRYSGDELNMPATMKLLKAFSDFTQCRPMTPLVLAIGADHVVPHLLQYERTARSVQG